MKQLSVCLASICFSLMLGPLSIQAQVDRSSAKEQIVLAEARGLLQAGKTEAAIQLLQNGPKNAPDKPEISYLLGLAYHQKSDYVHAVEYLAAAVNGLPQTGGEYHQATQLLGQSHYLLGHYKDAIPFLEKTSQRVPDSAEINYALGASYIQTRNPDKSRQAFA